MKAMKQVAGQICVVQQFNGFHVTTEIKLNSHIYSRTVGVYRDLDTAFRMAEGEARNEGFPVRYWEGSDDSEMGTLLTRENRNNLVRSAS